MLQLPAPRRTSVIVFLLAALTPLLRAQQPSSTPPIEIGGGGAVGLVRTTSDFFVDSLARVVDASPCGSFVDGTGRLLQVRFHASRAIDEILRAGLSLAVTTASVEASFDCIDPADIRMPDGSVVPARTRHVAEVDWTTFAPRLFGELRLARLFGRLAVGLDLGGRPTFATREEIVTPREASFVSGGQVRTGGSGTFAEGWFVAPTFGLEAGVRLQAGAGWHLEPSIVGEMQFGSMTPRGDLRSLQLLASLAIVREIVPRIDTTPPPPVTIVPTTAATPREPMGRLTLRSLDPTEPDTLRLQVDRAIDTRLHPLLPFLFFDEMASTLPERYRREGPRTFDLARLSRVGTLELYHHLLDIIGERLRERPQARLTITGTAPDAGSDEGALDLAGRRADVVAEYLRRTWRIPDERLRIETLRSPTVPSNPESPDGRTENRRVELVSDDPEITAPILFFDTTRVEPAAPFVARLELPAATSEAAAWRLVVRDSTLAAGALGRAPIDTLMRLELQRPGTMIVAHLELSDEVDVTVSDTLAVRRHLAVAEPKLGSGSYSLILFEFNRSRLRDEHRSLLDFVRRQTPQGARIDVLGYTDRTGSDALNQRLSQERAAGVANELGPGVARVEGLGSSLLLHDNDLPEGRFYSRSVTIRTELPPSR